MHIYVGSPHPASGNPRAGKRAGKGKGKGTGKVGLTETNNQHI